MRRGALRRGSYSKFRFEIVSVSPSSNGQRDFHIATVRSGHQRLREQVGIGLGLGVIRVAPLHQREQRIDQEILSRGFGFVGHNEDSSFFAGSSERGQCIFDRSFRHREFRPANRNTRKLADEAEQSPWQAR
jgi:hypothetical protein